MKSCLLGRPAILNNLIPSARFSPAVLRLCFAAFGLVDFAGLTPRFALLRAAVRGLRSAALRLAAALLLLFRGIAPLLSQSTEHAHCSGRIAPTRINKCSLREVKWRDLSQVRAISQRVEGIPHQIIAAIPRRPREVIQCRYPVRSSFSQHFNSASCTQSRMRS
jgi:hypothetical protein